MKLHFTSGQIVSCIDLFDDELGISQHVKKQLTAFRVTAQFSWQVRPD